jgi:plastocyanin
MAKTVKIKQSGFDPDTVEQNPGGGVEFVNTVNTDQVVHFTNASLFDPPTSSITVPKNNGKKTVKIKSGASGGARSGFNTNIPSNSNQAPRGTINGDIVVMEGR